MVAAQCRRLDCLTLLLQAPDLLLDARDCHGETAVFYAARVGWDEGLLLLLKAGAGRGWRNSQGLSAAEVAASQGLLVTQALLESDPRTLHIHDVCAQGKHQHVLALFRQGCPYNFRDERKLSPTHSLTPLMAACRAGQIDVVRILLRISAIADRINEQDAQGLHALSHAAANGHTDITFILLGCGADRALVDRAGLTAQAHASRHGMATLLAFMSQLVVA